MRVQNYCITNTKLCTTDTNFSPFSMVAVYHRWSDQSHTVRRHATDVALIVSHPRFLSAHPRVNDSASRAKDNAVHQLQNLYNMSNLVIVVTSFYH